ncbi:MAG: TolC family protein [Pseudomonadota bacterium]
MPFHDFHTAARFGRAGLILPAYLAGLLLFIASYRVAADTPLPLEEAQRHAVAASSRIAAQDEAVIAFRHTAGQARELPDPVITLGIDNLPIDGADQFSVSRDFMTMRRIGITQVFTTAEKRQLRGERLDRAGERARLERDALVADIQRDTALAWLERYYAEALGRVMAEQISEAALAVDAAETAYRTGRGGQSDVLAARSARIEAEDRASEADRRIRTAIIMLARWIGPAAQAPLADIPDMARIPFDPDSIETHFMHHPEIRALAEQVAIARAESQLARADKKPDWTWELIYSQRGPAYSNMVSVGVSVPLPWNQANRQDREVAAKLALVEQARAQREDVLRMHTSEVRAMLEEWQNNQRRRGRYQQELLPLAQQGVQAALTAYRGAKADLTDVLAARRNALDLRLQALQLDLETARLWARLAFLFPRNTDPAPAATAATLLPTPHQEIK